MSQRFCDSRAFFGLLGTQGGKTKKILTPTYQFDEAFYKSMKVN